jgi:NAD(P)-dependent dehydrogenase (short-subunit alcohol dehydrogenase family)
MERFGRIDTWVNNAGISIFGRNEDVPLEDMQRLFQTNYWGVVHGSLEAVKHMKTRGGGAIINLGSELSDRSVPLQGLYSASKHAVKAFTDALRMELEKEGAPMSVTLIKPAAIDTMFAVHAKNYMEKEPALPPPIYAPEDRGQIHPVRGPASEARRVRRRRLEGDFVGGFAMPRVLDKFMNASMFKQQQSTCPARRTGATPCTSPIRATSCASARAWTMSTTWPKHCAYTAVSLRANKIMPALLGAGALFAAWKLARRPALRSAF